MSKATKELTKIKISKKELKEYLLDNCANPKDVYLFGFDTEHFKDWDTKTREEMADFYRCWLLDLEIQLTETLKDIIDEDIRDDGLESRWLYFAFDVFMTTADVIEFNEETGDKVKPVSKHILVDQLIKFLDYREEVELIDENTGRTNEMKMITKTMPILEIDVYADEYHQVKEVRIINNETNESWCSDNMSDIYRYIRENAEVDQAGAEKILENSQRW